jgi:hypothetical protein
VTTTTDINRMKAIASVLTSQHITPVFFSSWDSLNAGGSFDPYGIVAHWDASTAASGEWGALSTIRLGRGGANPVPGPLAQFQVPRCLDKKPKVGIVCAARANHAGLGGPKTLGDGRVLGKDNANAHMYGSESAWAGPTETPNSYFWVSYYGLGYAIREVLG